MNLENISSRSIVKFLINDCTNDFGLLSRNYPANNEHLLSDLDDYLPFLMYFGEYEYCRQQILLSQQLYKENNLVIDKGRCISFLNNEYLGGILHYYYHKKDDEILNIIQQSINAIEKNFLHEGLIVSFSRKNGTKKSKIMTPLTGALLEVLIEAASIVPEAIDLPVKSIDYWINSDFFYKYGLFPSKSHIDSNIWNNFFIASKTYLPLKIQNRLGTQFYRHSKWSDYLFELPIGLKVQTAKDNTNLIFSIIELFKLTKELKYKMAIIKWIDSYVEHLIFDGHYFRFWQINNKPKVVSLDHIHPIIDILCDTYKFIDKNKRYLNLASTIVDTCLNKYRLKNGLLPKELGKDNAFLDVQTDFIVSLHRLYELTGDNKYKVYSFDIFENILKYFLTSDGFITYYDNKKFNQKITSPKYNALLLKAFILIEDSSFKIYENEDFHKLMKDR